MTHSDEQSAAVVIPKAVFWGLILPLIAGICGGSWYMAALSMTVSSQGVRLTQVESKTETQKDSNVSTTAVINDRLTRMEAQLSFLVKTSEGGKH